MLKPELLAELTAENLSGLEPADKHRVIEILKDLELTGYQRHMRNMKAIHRAWLVSYELQGIDPTETIEYADIVARVRKLLDERERRNDPNFQLSAGEKLSRELYNAPDHQAFLAREAAEQERQAQERLASCKAAQERYLQNQPKAEPEINLERVSNLPRLVSIAEVARAAQEQAFAESNREQPDFLDRICGPRFNKPSGRSGGGKLGFMG